MLGLGALPRGWVGVRVRGGNSCLRGGDVYVLGTVMCACVCMLGAVICVCAYVRGVC